MPDGLTAPATHGVREPAPPRSMRQSTLVAGQAVVVLVLFVAAGPLCGWLWYHVWDVPEGVVSGGQWFTTEAGLRADFDGVGWYVSIAVLGGFVLGTLSALLLARSEVVTLVAVVTGSVLAGYLMLRLGQQLSPPDPHELARTASDGTRLPGSLQVDSWTPRAAFPFGALAGLAVVFTATVGRTREDAGAPDSTQIDGTPG